MNEPVLLGALAAAAGVSNDVVLTIARELGRLPRRVGPGTALFTAEDARAILDRYRAVHEPDVLRYAKPRRNRRADREPIAG